MVSHLVAAVDCRIGSPSATRSPWSDSPPGRATQFHAPKGEQGEQGEAATSSSPAAAVASPPMAAGGASSQAGAASQASQFEAEADLLAMVS